MSNIKKDHENRNVHSDSDNLSLDDMIGRYSAVERIDSVELKHAFKNR